MQPLDCSDAQFGLILRVSPRPDAPSQRFDGENTEKPAMVPMSFARGE